MSVHFGRKKMIYCCEEHVDQAIDQYINEYKTFPILEKIVKKDVSTTCEYCRNLAVYMVGNE